MATHSAGVLDALERCGFRRCPDGANATSPLFSRTHTQWAEVVRKWVSDPSTDRALIFSSIVVDSRPLTEVPLGRSLTEALRARPRPIEYTHAFLLEALWTKPPTGFVREFVVDHSGQHRGHLDLKRGGLIPVAALARWVAVVTGDSRGSTIDRLRRGVDARLLTQDESDTLVGAFEHSYGVLMQREIQAIRQGVEPTTFIKPDDLDTLARRHLRETFRAIASVQSSVEAGWRTRLNV
jgi:CBS domain-containing protein